MNEKNKKKEENCDDIIDMILNEATTVIETELQNLQRINDMEDNRYDDIDVGV